MAQPIPCQWVILVERHDPQMPNGAPVGMGTGLALHGVMRPHSPSPFRAHLPQARRGIHDARGIHGGKVHGLLLGAALGDVMGLPYEGLSRVRIARHLPPRPRDETSALLALWHPLVPSFTCPDGEGRVSDDTEQLVLLGEAMLGARSMEHVVSRFRRALLQWVARLPFGIGFGTLRAACRLVVGSSGSSSAGNGAMMRAPVLGLLEESIRRPLGEKIAALTHSDRRAIEASLFAAEVAACALQTPAAAASSLSVRERIVTKAKACVTEPTIRAAIAEGVRFGTQRRGPRARANRGFAPASVALCTACFLRDGHSPPGALAATIREGGDTDTHAAIVGAWVGALHGAEGFSSSLRERIPKGPFGREHLAALARAFAEGGEAPRWSPFRAAVRNVTTFPWVLYHGVRRRFW